MMSDQIESRKPSGFGSRAGRQPPAWLALSDRDQLSRRLRISLVDHCNFRCFFCHNEGQGPLGRRGAVFSVDQLVRLCEAALAAGVREIKLTGGEPLLYRQSGSGIVDLVARIAALRRNYVFGLSMTTNGLLLGLHANALAEAGLDRVTVSLHTLDQETLRGAIYKGGSDRTLKQVISGISAARSAGLGPLKVNTVLFAATNDDSGNLKEVSSLARFCREQRVDEWRLYTLIANRNLSGDVFRRRYRFWDEETLGVLSSELGQGTAEAKGIASAINDFASRWSAELYPKPTLHLQLQGLSVAIEAMADERFSMADLTSEGPYALRLSAAGVLRGALEGGRARPLLGLVRSGAERGELVRAFTEARMTLLPEELGEGAAPLGQRAVH